MKFIAVGFVQIFSTLFHGFILTLLWSWFAVTIFHLPVLTLWPAIGIMTLIEFLTQRISTNAAAKDIEINKSTIISSLSASIVYPLLSLLIGFIAHLMM